MIGRRYFIPGEGCDHGSVHGAGVGLIGRKHVERNEIDAKLHVVSSLDGFIAKKDNSVSWMERVRVSAEGHAKLGLAAVAMTVPGRILGVALRQCPGLPPTIAERIKDYRAQNVADWVMYRKALAAAAEARGIEDPRCPLPPCSR
jgi:hypothetical protein